MSLERRSASTHFVHEFLSELMQTLKQKENILKQQITKISDTIDVLISDNDFDQESIDCLRVILETYEA